ncbi:hypothetical protein [Streptomyces sp. NPDC051310]|uniref:hypothetical protein n=1 Tax=Streptomyces sp. NPDC051310 TaxID=3365649 RepID=UPI0037919158
MRNFCAGCPLRQPPKHFAELFHRSAYSSDANNLETPAGVVRRLVPGVVWAGVFAVIAAPGSHRTWGACASVGYLCAAVAALRPRGRALSVGFAPAGAVAVPLLVLLAVGGAQSEVGVIERSGVPTPSQATPYLAEPRTVVEVTPYLPGMAVFGLPRAVLGDRGPLPGLGDARLWCAAAFLGCLWVARRATRRGTDGPRTGAGGTVRTRASSCRTCGSFGYRAHHRRRGRWAPVPRVTDDCRTCLFTAWPIPHHPSHEGSNHPWAPP